MHGTLRFLHQKGDKIAATLRFNAQKRGFEISNVESRLYVNPRIKCKVAFESEFAKFGAESCSELFWILNKNYFIYPKYFKTSSKLRNFENFGEVFWQNF